jgi:hypothetical protein
MFPPMWIALMLFGAGSAIAYGEPAVVVLFLVALPLLRGSVSLGVERWQATHYAGLAGAPRSHHSDWHYREAEQPVRQRWGRRCARCDAHLERGRKYVEGVVKLPQRPRIGQPTGPGGMPLSKHASIWAASAYCPSCGRELYAAGSAPPPPEQAWIADSPPLRRLPWRVVTAAGIAGAVLMLALVTS